MEDRLQTLLKAQAKKRNEKKERKKHNTPRVEREEIALPDRIQQVKDEYREMDRETASLLSEMMTAQGSQMGSKTNTETSTGYPNEYPHDNPNGYTRLGSQIIAKTTDENFKNERPSGSLSKNESLIWTLICELKKFTLKTAQIAEYTGVSLDTTRKILYRFRDHNLIEINQHPGGAHYTGLDIKKLVTLASEVTIPSLNIKNKMATLPPLVVSKLEEETTIYKNIKEINEIYIAENYPTLFDLGFGENQITQCIKYWTDNAKHISLENLKLSLTHAEWFATNKRPDNKGKQVRDYLSYIFTFLKKNASFRAQNYKSEEAKAKIADQEIRKKAAKKLIDEQEKQKVDAFNADINLWIKGLNVKEKQEILSTLEPEYYSMYKTENEKLRVYAMINNK